MRAIIGRAAAAGLAALCWGAPARAADPSGVWLTETGSSRVRIAPCGGGYCGTIVHVPGKALDARNPDPALRGRSVVGVRILDAPTADGAGYTGTLYNPSDGKTYSGSMRLNGPDTLEVSGCVLGILCKKQVWSRVN